MGSRRLHGVPLASWQVVVLSLEEAKSCSVSISISRAGVALTENEALLGPAEHVSIPLLVPSDNSNSTATYKLRIRGTAPTSSGMSFVEGCFSIHAYMRLHLSFRKQRLPLHRGEGAGVIAPLLGRDHQPQQGVPISLEQHRCL